MALIRFGVSLEQDLLEKFDDLMEEKGWVNRSEAVRDLMREALVRREWEKEDGETVGTITLVFDHHVRELGKKLTSTQHHHYTSIITTLHVHLDSDHCLEVLVVKGRAREIRALADRLIGTRGVKHGKLTLTTTGSGIA
jgi:CopG family nickel-responsive transcriptional regulator